MKMHHVKCTAVLCSHVNSMHVQSIPCAPQRLSSNLVKVRTWYNPLMVVTIPMVTFTSYQLPLVMIIQVTGLTFFTKLSFDSHKFFREAEALIWQYTQLCGQLGNEVGETNWQPDDLFNQDRILCVFFSS